MFPSQINYVSSLSLKMDMREDQEKSYYIDVPTDCYILKRGRKCFLTYIKFIEGSSQFTYAGMAMLLISG